jgi:DME family drug/metabolite transporter
MDIGPGLGALCALGSGLTWAVINLMVRTLTPPFNSVSINALRTTVAGGLLVAWVLVTRGLAELTSVSAADFALLAFSIVLASSLGDTVFFESTRRVGLAPALTISMTYPLVATLFATAFLAEPVTARLLVGAVLTLSGLAMIVAARGGAAADGRQWWLGFGCAIVASLSWAVSAILLKAPLREIDALTAQALRMPLSGLLLFATPWARGTFEHVARSTPSQLRLLAVLCVLTCVSSTLFTAGLKYASVAVGTVLSSTAPMWAVPLAYVGLGERLSPLALAGLAITIVGIIALQL